jgi:hypothetical protein
MPDILDMRAAAAMDGRDVAWAATATAAVPGARENRRSGKRNTEGHYRQRSGDSLEQRIAHSWLLENWLRSMSHVGHVVLGLRTSQDRNLLSPEFMSCMWSTLTGRAVTVRVLDVRDAATTRSASVHYPWAVCFPCPQPAVWKVVALLTRGFFRGKLPRE